MNQGRSERSEESRSFGRPHDRRRCFSAFIISFPFDRVISW